MSYYIALSPKCKSHGTGGLFNSRCDVAFRDCQTPASGHQVHSDMKRLPGFVCRTFPKPILPSPKYAMGSWVSHTHWPECGTFHFAVIPAENRKSPTRSLRSRGSVIAPSRGETGQTPPNNAFLLHELPASGPSIQHSDLRADVE